MSDEDYSCVCSFDIMVLAQLWLFVCCVGIRKAKPYEMYRNENFRYYVLEGDLV
jgi:hypothetical protein